MQVHERPQAAPVLVLRGIKNTGIFMQSHAPYGCMAFSGKIAEFSGIFLRATVRPVLHVGGCKS
ncbi:hypothetical protein M8360_25780, partial [Klebsiella pneumoniae]|nr:hypothetical protein [Klebsiella pneumoniae]